MALNKFAVPVLALLLFPVIVAGATVLPISLAMAHDDQGAPVFERHVGDHMEGHIAFLKAELQITPAQEALWDKVATAMRADVKDFEHLRPQTLATVPTPPTALRHLEERAAYTALQAKCEQRFLVAFRPLYEQFSGAQKRAADDLLGQWHEEL